MNVLPSELPVSAPVKTAPVLSHVLLTWWLLYSPTCSAQKDWSHLWLLSFTPQVQSISIASLSKIDPENDFFSSFPLLPPWSKTPSSVPWIIENIFTWISHILSYFSPFLLICFTHTGFWLFPELMGTHLPPSSSLGMERSVLKTPVGMIPAPSICHTPPSKWDLPFLY